ncbi:abscission/NoCut checkpoint regulator-like isoform X3 [Zophobas morio]|uniref:abscission/NoCut checkpoint regulator-like isoform X3 n=1 Tax=Zophobas morio TaxID=2755281 RepID=UPI003082E4B7
MQCHICFRKFSKKLEELECEYCKKSVCNECLKIEKNAKKGLCALCCRDKNSCKPAFSIPALLPFPIEKNKLNITQASFSLCKLEERVTKLKNSSTTTDSNNTGLQGPARSGKLSEKFTNLNLKEDNLKYEEKILELKKFAQELKQQQGVRISKTDLEKGVITTGSTPCDKKCFGQEEGSSSEEFPWCNICNDDAVLSCPACENELFCQSCFLLIHGTRSMKKHKPIHYSPKSNSRTTL